MFRTDKLRNKATTLALLLVSVAMLVLAGCAGNTDGGNEGEEDFAGAQFVATDGTAGTVALSVANTNVSVASTTRYTVRVRDASDAPVAYIGVSCDTEKGLALIEPASGLEHTDSFGNMSGILGCELPGSFLVGCRIPVGGSKRSFSTVHCSGSIPAGFAGFPGSGGGNLGGLPSGDVDAGNDGGIGGTDTTGLRITSIEFLDAGDSSEGASSTTSIDVSRDTCNDGNSEPFYDTHVRVKIVNNTNQNVNLNRMQYRVANSDGSGTSFTSDRVALVGEVTPSEGGETTFVVLFANAISSSSGKRFIGNSSDIPSSGFVSSVKVTMSGTNGAGVSVQASASTSASFDNFTRCPQ